MQKTAVERERIFITKKVRHDTEESDEEGYFDKAVDGEAEVEEYTNEKKMPTTVQFKPVPFDIEEEEQAEFPEELPNQFGFGGFQKMGKDDRT